MVILTAALGIGLNTSIFSVVYAVLLRPLPYRDAGRLVAPTNVSKETFFGWGVGDFQYAGWRDQAGVFDGIAACTGRQFTITGSGEPERLTVANRHARVPERLGSRSHQSGAISPIPMQACAAAGSTG